MKAAARRWALFDIVNAALNVARNVTQQGFLHCIADPNADRNKADRNKIEGMKNSAAGSRAGVGSVFVPVRSAESASPFR